MAFAAQDYYLVKVWRIMDHGLFADRPSADSPDRLWWASDEKVLYRDTGSAWHRISSFDGHAFGDTIANRPVFGVVDRLFFATDEAILYRDTGLAWEAIGVGGDHHSRHENGGSDEINVAGLSGELADRQPVKLHAVQHVTGGDDVISNAIAAGNSGLLTGADKTKIDDLGAGANVAADANIGDHKLVRGDGGAKKIQECFRITVVDDGGVVNTRQPAFQAYVNSSQLNVTGDGTFYSVTGNFWTAYYDSCNDFSNGTFQAPLTGKYIFTAIFYLRGILAAHNVMGLKYVTSNYTYSVFGLHPGNIRDGNNDLLLNISVVALMDANDTAHLQIMVSGGTKVVDVPSSYNRFMGHLLI